MEKELTLWQHMLKDKKRLDLTLKFLPTRKERKEEDFVGGPLNTSCLVSIRGDDLVPVLWL